MVWVQVYVMGCAVTACLIAVALHLKGLTPSDLEELSGAPPGSAPVGMVMTILLWPVMFMVMLIKENQR